MTTDLPGTNYSSPYGTDDLAFEQQVYRDEFLERMRLIFGHPDYLSVSGFGLVAETDPSAAATGSSSPGALSASGTQISVQPALAITRSGHRIALTSTVTKTVASSEDNAINVVTLKYSTANPSSASTSAFHGTTYRRRVSQSADNLVVVYTLGQYNALTQAQQDDHIPLGIGTVTTDNSGNKTVTLTHTDTNYTWLRPWFSPVDWAHRKQVGTGTVSDTNPHAVSANELTVGNFTLPRLSSSIGLVVSQDVSIPHVPGTLCSNIFSFGQILADDVSGTLTGVANTAYIDLGFFPVTLGVVIEESTGKELPFEHLAGTTIIYQPQDTDGDLTPSDDLTVYCTRVDALEPAYSSVITSFTAGTPDTYEAVVANGQVSVNGSTLTLTDNMSDAGPMPLTYTFYLATNQVVKNPQPILCYTKLTDIASSGVTPSITQFGNGIALVALDQASAGATLDVQIKITGLDADGAAAEETLSFGASWTQSTFPLCSTPTSQYARGTTTFSSVTNVSVLQNLNSGANATIHVWIVMDPATTNTLRGACPIAYGQWNGSNFCTFYDIRPIHHSFSIEDNAAYARGVYEQVYLPSTAAEPGTTHVRGYTYCENFNNPKYGTLRNLSTATGAFGLVPEHLRLFDRNCRGLRGYYESRPLVLSKGYAGSLDTVVVLLWPPIQNRLEPSIRYRVYDDNLAAWSDWLVMSQEPLSWPLTGFFAVSPVATACAIKLQIYGQGINGFTLIEYT